MDRVKLALEMNKLVHNECKDNPSHMKYTIEQLKHLRNIRALGYDASFYDDKHNSDRGFFELETENFFNWLEKMERNGKINELLGA